MIVSPRVNVTIPLSALYEQARYNGPVQIGIAVTGLSGAVSNIHRQFLIGRNATSYKQNDYRRPMRTVTTRLHDEPYTVAQSLVMPLVNTLNQGSYDPFSQWT